MEFNRFYRKRASLWAHTGKGHRFNCHSLSLLQYSYGNSFILFSAIYNFAGTTDMQLLSPRGNGAKSEEQNLRVANKVTANTYQLMNHEKLLFSVFSLLQNLGADDRPEVIKLYTRLRFCCILFSDHYNKQFN